MSWRVAKSLEKLLGQLNALFPNRAKVSDGAVGNAEHASRKSDHNPWFKDSKGTGIVSARDFTFDNNPADGVGIDCHWLAKVLFESRDPRIKYIIWNGRITKKDKSGWKPYNGPNPHKHHLHLSVVSDPALYDDMSPWNLDLSATVETPVAAAGIPATELKHGSKGEAVANLQRALSAHGLLKSSDIDGDFGNKTEMAVKEYQANYGLRPDGIAGRNTLRSLGLGG
ncbi:MAG: peptidoglycan-binding protein [Desulfurellales bacterium]|nr:MAG: peptidoglycan-binding protein [Desulfurellales bacterium]